jgi:serine O-acetyltransferase
MKVSLPADELAQYLQRQISTTFPDGDGDSLDEVKRFVGPALERLEHCFSHIAAKGFRADSGPCFHHRHSDQYAIFLYFVANCAFRLAPGHPLAEKAYGLNKALNGLDAYFEVELPDIFMLVHPVGTVLGRALYADYFCSYQNVTVGSNLAGGKPEIGEGVVLYGGSRVIGGTRIGANCMVSTGTILLDQTIANNSLVFGVAPANIIKPSKRDVKAEVFGVRP